MSEQNHYSVFGVTPNASQAEIKLRFRFLCHAFHPDKFCSPSHRVIAEQEFKRINEAYAVLSDPAKKANFDLVNNSIKQQSAEARNQYEQSVNALLKWILESNENPNTKLNTFKLLIIPEISGLLATNIGAKARNEMFDAATVLLRTIAIDAWKSNQDISTSLEATRLALKGVRNQEMKQQLIKDEAALIHLASLRGQW